MATDEEALDADEEQEEDNEDSSNLLTQGEIDNLLGFEAEGDKDKSYTGLEAILDSGLVSYERLPMLEVVFDRLVRLMSTNLRNFTTDNVEVSLEGITSIRFGDYIDAIPLPAILSVFKAEEWDNYGLLTIDSSLVYSLVDVLLGGRHGTAVMRIEGRPYTIIERNLVEKTVKVILEDLSRAFDPISSVSMRFDRLETNPRFASIARPDNAAILARFRVDMENRGGRLDMLLPYATLEPVRELLLQQFMGEKFGRDSIWENHLATELWFTEVDLNIVIARMSARLSDVMNKWKPGYLLTLGNVNSDTPVEAESGEVPIFRGLMGQRNNNVAMKIFERLVDTES